MTDPKPRKSRKRPPRQEHTLHGESVSPGIATGPAAIVRESPMPTLAERTSSLGTDAERARFEDAIARSLHQLEKLQRKLDTLPEEGRVEIGSLLAIYQRMLGQSRLTRAIRAKIDSHALRAEAAVLDETEALARTAEAAPTNTPEEEEAARRRAGEFREIGRRVLRNLTGVSFRAFSAVPPGSILVAEQLRPADAALIDPGKIRAVLTEAGGSSDHTAIMLRALDIPAILAVPTLLDRVTDGDTLIVDANDTDDGTITIHPASETLCRAKLIATEQAKTRQGEKRLRRLPAKLTSGELIDLQANVELPAELPAIKRAGAAGIGLMRTEFLLGNDETMPGENAQRTIYAEFIEAMAGNPTTIRVLDWGGEKGRERLAQLGMAHTTEGENPALGLRGLRLLLRHPHILETQFAAILRAAIAGSVRVLLPMVTSAHEIIQARDLYERTARRLRRKGVALPEALPPLGIMVETPAAALTADTLAQHADFLALGTNDLTMYTLAVDRASAEVAPLYTPLHPAVLRLIGTTANAAMRTQRPISVCGEMAADPRAVALLIGLGLRSFSMSASAIPRVKKMVRALSLEQCAQLRRQVMLETDPAELRTLIRNFKPD